MEAGTETETETEAEADYGTKIVFKSVPPAYA